MDVFQLIVSIVGFLVAIGSLWYTAHQGKRTGVLLASHQAKIDKELAEFQHSLDLDSQLNFERFRSGLEIQMAENRWIREKRFGIIQELYAHLANCLFLAEKMVTPPTDGTPLKGGFLSFVGGLAEGSSDEVRLAKYQNLATALSDFRKSYLRDRLVLDHSTCVVLDEVEAKAIGLVGILFTGILKDVIHSDNEQQKQVLKFLEMQVVEILPRFQQALLLFEEEAKRILPDGN